MHPIIFQFGPFTVYAYGLMLAVAVMVCSFLMSQDARPLGIKSELVFDFIFWMTILGIIGARIFFIIFHWEFFSKNLLEIIMIQKGGLSWQGGLILGALAGILFIRKHQWPLLKTFDLVAPYLALGQAIGRVGCFLNGCCFGKEVSWGIYFPVHGERLHPTQLYSSSFLLAIFFILKAYQKRTTVPGRVLMLYFMLACTERFIVEFFRADHVLSVFGLSEFQLVSLGIFFIALFVNIRLVKSK